MMKIKQCTGNGQGSCILCESKGMWNRTWMCFLYKIDGMNGTYCSNCVNEMLARERETKSRIKKEG